MSKNPKDKELEIAGWKIKYQDSKHRYMVTDPGSGETFRSPSASQITKTMDINGKSGKLMGWAARMGSEALREHLSSFEGAAANLTGTFIEELVKLSQGAYRKRTDKAADRGKEVHGWCEEYCQSIIDGTTKVPILSGKSPETEFLKWFERYEVEPIAVENIVFHPELEYAGTFDLLCWLTYQGKRRLCVVDFKTSNYFNLEMLAQVACYMEAVPVRWPEYQPDLGLILMLDRKTDPNYHCEWIEGQRREDAWNAFVAARVIYGWGEANG